MVSTPNAMFTELTLRNFLSFGPDADPISLGPLNVLVGPNGSGKSNLVEALELLTVCPKKEGLVHAVRAGGGMREWIWRDAPPSERAFTLVVRAEQRAPARVSLRHSLRVAEVGQSLEVELEVIDEPSERAARAPHFERSSGRETATLGAHPLPSSTLSSMDSILAQIRSPVAYPELNWLGSVYERTCIYRDWAFGRKAAGRRPESTAEPGDFLRPDCTNIAMVLSAFRRKPAVKRRFIDFLQRLAPQIDGYEIVVEGGTIQFFLQEGEGLVPGVRLSDGTLRYVALLAILLHPSPPPVTVIEEPELGLHPDIMPTLAELLVDASSRTQVIATTHSDILVDALTDHAEALLICDKGDTGTRIRRPEAEEIEPWLAGERGLGQTWLSGVLGGKRW